MLQELTYQQPTCQLWLTGEVNPLLAWSKEHWQNLQFTLRLPGTADELGPQIHGGQSDFEQLYFLVNDYIQQILAHKLPPCPSPVTSERNGFLAVSESEPGLGLSPQSQLQHQLHLGPLAQTTSPVTITLGLSELFDLGTVLSESWAVLHPAPGLGYRARLAIQNTPIWLQSTAVAVVVLGLGTVLMPLLQPEPMMVSQDSPLLESLPPLGIPEAPLPHALDLENLPLEPEAADSEPMTLPPLPPLTRSPAPPIALEPGEPLPPPPATQVPIPPNPNPATGQTATVIPGPANRDSTPRIDTGLPPGVITSPQAGAEALRPVPGNAEVVAPAGPAAVARNLTLGAANGQAIEAVRAYFNQRWQPPGELTQTLEYTLILNPDGSLERALPLNRAAEIYIDRTPIPLANEPFIPATQAPAQVQLRLVLEPGGRVQVFGQN